MADGISTGLSRGSWTAAQGRSFAFTVGAAFMVLAGIVWWRGHGFAATVLAGLGATLIAAGVVAPQQLGPVYRAWMRLALAISKVTTPLLLGIVYFLVLTPVGLIRRAWGRNSLVQPLVGDSYWKARAPGARQSDLERQF